MPTYRNSRLNKKPEEKPEDDLTKYPPSDIVIPLITRDKWFGIPPEKDNIVRMTGPHTQVCFVPTECTPCDTTEECIKEVPEIQKRNMVYRKWPDIPFNFLIGGDGMVYEGRGWLNGYKNHGSTAMQEALQIGYIGHYKDTDPPKKMVDLGCLLVEYGKQRKLISQDYTYIECPLREYFQFSPTWEALYETEAYKEIVKSIPPPYFPQGPPTPSEPPKEPLPPVPPQ